MKTVLLAALISAPIILSGCTSTSTVVTNPAYNKVYDPGYSNDYVYSVGYYNNRPYWGNNYYHYGYGVGNYGYWGGIGLYEGY